MIDLSLFKNPEESSELEQSTSGSGSCYTTIKSRVISTSAAVPTGEIMHLRQTVSI